jgi:hypothetical protein
MISRFRFSFEENWLSAPMAYWVHIPTSEGANTFEPPAPLAIAKQGYPFLRFEYDIHELIFSSPAQLNHMIEVLSTKPLPSSARLSAGRQAGPNGHWLSRLPAELKSPKGREQLVKHLKAVRKQVLRLPPRAKATSPNFWPFLYESGVPK